MTDLFTDAGSDLPTLARFVQGRVFPAYESRTLDIGPRLCYEAIARAAGQNISADDVEERLADMGEIGAVAASYDLGGQQGLAAFGAGGSGSDALTVAELDTKLRDLAAVDGSGSQGTKVDILFGLFSRCSPAEASYLARLVLSEMRIGVGEGTVRDAVAAAFDVPVEAVERAVQVSNDYGMVAEVARDEGESGLATVTLEIGRPVQAMLAQAGTVAGALEDWDRAAVEWKYDGARVQVHFDGEDARLFSRNMEEVTDRSRRLSRPWSRRWTHRQSSTVRWSRSTTAATRSRFRRSCGASAGNTTWPRHAKTWPSGYTHSTVCTPPVRTCSTPRWKRATTVSNRCSRLTATLSRRCGSRTTPTRLKIWKRRPSTLDRRASC